jgi:predicted NAD/FAD-binding protein
VDAGFTVFNENASPNFRKLLDQLRVPIRPCNHSFAFWDEKTGFNYALTGLNGAFAQRSNLWKPRFWLMARELAWFRQAAPRDLASGLLAGLTLGEYLEEENYSEPFVEDYLVPLGSAVWYTSVREMENFPAALFVRALGKLGYLGFGPCRQWRILPGGSHTYVKAILKNFQTRVRVGEAVVGVKRGLLGVQLRTGAGQEQDFDKVVLACHADEALALLTDPTEEEQRLLSLWEYQKNYAVLHTDPHVLHHHKRAWASWNYIRERDATLTQPVPVTYNLSRMQGLESREPYFLSLNRVRPIPEGHIVREMYYTQPIFTKEAVALQKELPYLNGMNHTFFCGSYFGDGFQEDAVKSGVAVGRCFGMDL